MSKRRESQRGENHKMNNSVTSQHPVGMPQG
jgi:hypothetical protein